MANTVLGQNDACLGCQCFEERAVSRSALLYRITLDKRISSIHAHAVLLGKVHPSLFTISRVDEAGDTILGNSSRDKDFITTADVDVTVGQFGSLLHTSTTEEAYR